MGVSSQIALENLGRQLKKARSILFITGAGMSADSGLPTYRGVGGLYEHSVTDEGIPIEMALAGDMLAQRPEITWKYLAQIERNCRGASFNRGHSIIAQIERRCPRVWILTQNIDGFHTAAGSQNVIEIHGNMRRLRCDGCGWHGTIKDFSEITIPPVCPQCRRSARPDVVFFGEILPQRQVQIYEEQLRQGFDLYIWIGTTSVFSYIQRPLYDARRRGAPTVEINPAETEISGLMDVRIVSRAAVALESIWENYDK